MSEPINVAKDDLPIYYARNSPFSYLPIPYGLRISYVEHKYIPFIAN